MLEDLENKHERPDIVEAVILVYKRMIEQLKRPNIHYNQKIEEHKEELRIKVMDLERLEIRNLYREGEISNEQAKELRRFINYIESVTLHEFVE